MHMYVYIYIHIHTSLSLYLSLSIYIYRERERDVGKCLTRQEPSRRQAAARLVRAFWVSGKGLSR